MNREDKMREIIARMSYPKFGKIYIKNLDQLEKEVALAEYEGEPFTVKDILDEAQWYCCDMCRDITDEGSFDFEKDFDDKEEFFHTGHSYIEELESETPGITEELKEVHRMHPNMKRVCWSCLSRYLDARKKAKEQKGKVKYSDMTVSGLIDLENELEEQLNSTKMCLDELNREYELRNLRKQFGYDHHYRQHFDEGKLVRDEDDDE